MKNFKYLLSFLVCFLILSNDSASAKVVFHGGYAFETFKGQKVAAAYVSIFNQSDKDLVIKSITSTICEVAEIHDTVLEGEIMRMKKVESLNIPARSEFYFQPGSTHIMLMGLNQELKDGTNFKLNFEFKNKQNLNVEIMVLNKKLRENLLDKK
tara:strand:+ start:964 stop:1425 length:462 start_codon:yes stop_codon:yes gene_type:complete